MPDASAPAPTRAPATPAAPLALRVPWKDIHRSPLNPRKNFDEAALKELADSIAAQGLLQNLVARPHPTKAGEYELVCGERRHRAYEILVKAGKAKPEDQLAIQVRRLDDREASLIALLENVERNDLTPLEEAEAFRKLVGLRMLPREIGEKIGKTERFVQLRLALLDRLAPKALDALRAGRISLEHARELVKAPAKRQTSILERIVPPGQKVEDPDDAYHYDSIFTAEHLRAELRRDMVPVAEAVFDAKLYKGAVFEDPDEGASFFEDPDQFEKLQSQAIETKAKELAKTHAAGVEFVRFDHALERLAKGELPYGWRKAPKDVVAAGKAAALFGVQAGKFVVATGLAKTQEARQSIVTTAIEGTPGAKATNKPAGGGPAPMKPEDVPTGAARQALVVRTQALQAAVAADAGQAKRAIVLALLGVDEMVRIGSTARAHMGFSAKSETAPGVDKTIEEFGKRGLKEGLGPMRLWPLIVALSPADLDRLFAALVARTVSVENPNAADCWPDEDELAIARTLRADPARTFKIDAAFLDKLKKGQLLRIVHDLKLALDLRFLMGSDALTSTAIRKIILDAGRKLDGYVPPWCRFQPAADMKAQLKATAAIKPAPAKKG